MFWSLSLTKKNKSCVFVFHHLPRKLKLRILITYQNVFRTFVCMMPSAKVTSTQQKVCLGFVFLCEDGVTFEQRFRSVEISRLFVELLKSQFVKSLTFSFPGS